MPTQMPIFETSRLLIRRLKQSDLAPFHEMQSDPEVMRYASGEPEDKPGNTASLNRCIEAYATPGNRFRIWAVEEKSTGKWVGTCALVAADEFKLPDDWVYASETLPKQIDEIGYRFLRSEWGKGWGGEVCHGLIDYCIEQLGVSTLLAQVDTRNVASVRILDRSKLKHLQGFAAPTSGCDRVYLWQRGENE